MPVDSDTDASAQLRTGAGVRVSTAALVASTSDFRVAGSIAASETATALSAALSAASSGLSIVMPLPPATARSDAGSSIRALTSSKAHAVADLAGASAADDRNSYVPKHGADTLCMKTDAAQAVRSSSDDEDSEPASCDGTEQVRTWTIVTEVRVPDNNHFGRGVRDDRSLHAWCICADRETGVCHVHACP